MTDRQKEWARREWLRATSLGLAGASMSGWFPILAQQAQAANKLDGSKPKRSCILLWMPGGPTQTDTFDMKPGHANGGEFKPIDTTVSGMQICEHMPQLAKQAEHLAIIRSMQTKEGDHDRATYHLRTGYRIQGPIQYPTFGSLVSHELGADEAELPNYVSILPARFLSPKAFGPGFLGPRRAPLIVAGENPGRRPRRGEAALEYGPPLDVKNLQLPREIQPEQADARLTLLGELETEFSKEHPGLGSESHQAAYRQAVSMMRSEARTAFDLDQEPAELRAAYGKNRFGQACLLARRLVERGVPFVEIALSSPSGAAGIGWDTHADNFKAVKNMCEVLDPAWATLLSDLKQRGLLDQTLVVWMGEFGRTPTINPQGGRDHFPNAWSTVLCGGPIRGGQVYGATEASGATVSDKPVPVNRFMATLCKSLGLDPTKQNLSNVGRPIRLVEPEATPIDELVAG